MRQRVLVVAARESMVFRLVEAVRGAGLKPDGIDLMPSRSCARSPSRRGDGRRRPSRPRLCHLGGVTNLAIAAGSICLFTRPLPPCGTRTTRASSLARRGDPALARLPPGAARRPPGGQIVLSGPGAHDEILADELGARHGLPVSVAEPLGALGTHAVPAGDDPYRYTVAAGLALGERRHEARQPSSRSDRAAGPPRARRQLASVLGVLGGLLLAVLAFVFTQNQVNDRTSEIAKAEQAQQAEQRSATLGAFGAFAAVKQNRVESVSELADARFDWERFMRELALVLPNGTSLSHRRRQPPAAVDRCGCDGVRPLAASARHEPPAGPTARRSWAAPRTSPRWPRPMVRLRKLHRAEDVKLAESARPDEPHRRRAPPRPTARRRH